MGASCTRAGTWRTPGTGVPGNSASQSDRSHDVTCIPSARSLHDRAREYEGDGRTGRAGPRVGLSLQLLFRELERFLHQHAALAGRDAAPTLLADDVVHAESLAELQLGVVAQDL